MASYLTDTVLLLNLQGLILHRSLCWIVHMNVGERIDQTHDGHHAISLVVSVIIFSGYQLASRWFSSPRRTRYPNNFAWLFRLRFYVGNATETSWTYLATLDLSWKIAHLGALKWSLSSLSCSSSLDDNQVHFSTEFNKPQTTISLPSSLTTPKTSVLGSGGTLWQT